MSGAQLTPPCRIPRQAKEVIGMTTTERGSPARSRQLVGRIFSTGVGAAELCTVYLGIHLGLYRALADVAGDRGGAGRTHRLRRAVPARVAAGPGDRRVRSPSTAPTRRRPGSRWPKEHYEVLVDETAPTYLGGLADVARRGGQGAAAAGRRLPHRRRRAVRRLRSGRGQRAVGAEPAGVRELAGRASGCRSCRTCWPGCRTPRTRHGWPTWPAAPAGPRSSWPRHSRTSRSTAGTTTRRRSRSAGGTRSTTAWPTG